jgi:hypothetical protein
MNSIKVTTGVWQTDELLATDTERTIDARCSWTRVWKLLKWIDGRILPRLSREPCSNGCGHLASTSNKSTVHKSIRERSTTLVLIYSSKPNRPSLVNHLDHAILQPAPHPHITSERHYNPHHVWSIRRYATAPAGCASPQFRPCPQHSFHALERALRGR